MAVRVQAADFDVGEEVRRLTAGRTDIGAVVTFTGTVRGEAGLPVPCNKFVTLLRIVSVLP